MDLDLVWRIKIKIFFRSVKRIVRLMETHCNEKWFLPALFHELHRSGGKLPVWLIFVTALGRPPLPQFFLPGLHVEEDVSLLVVEPAAGVRFQAERQLVGRRDGERR